MRIVYCEEKNKALLQTLGRKTCFDEIIDEIESENFLIIKNTSTHHVEQKCFLVDINDYPIVAPFNIRADVIQLITFFPDRRYK
jgi:hypothetical protein